MQCNFLFVLLVCFWFCCLCFVYYTQGVDAYLLWHCFRNSLDSVVLYQSNLCWPRFYGQHMIKILFYPIAFSLFFSSTIYWRWGWEGAESMTYTWGVRWETEADSFIEDVGLTIIPSSQGPKDVTMGKAVFSNFPSLCILNFPVKTSILGMYGF